MNKEKILRDLEYLSGGINAMIKMCNSKANVPFYDLMVEWNDIVYNIMDEVKNNENAKQPTRVS